MKAFLVRIGLFIPMVMFGVFVLMVGVGIAASAVGAQASFYCNVYCKVGVALFTVALVSVIACQANACFRKHR